ncbi:MAG TPA: AlkA N-terminal domain-containing protein [Burkholderiaceae bacterium]|nr:AlkA N-terminal domain-containing protein [Burkholderiaceae bacterium]
METALDSTRIDDDSAYRAIVAHDARFDGRLFIGVTSTGVYCRPVCRVRTPMRRNCRFFANAPSAEAAGFRPCLRCRPELAPGLALVDSPQVLALHAARMLDAAVRAGDPDVALPAVAAKLGVTDRHLRRIFMAAHGVTPIDYLTTQRLLLAKHLLTDTDLALSDVAFAAGFGSQRRFNAAFAERYRLAPGALRRIREQDGGAAQRTHAAVPGPLLRLAYRPPYDAAGVIGFFAARAVPGIEAVDRDALTLRRTLAWQHQGRRLAGWLTARFVPERHEVEARIAPALAPALGAVVQRLRQGLDLDADPAPIGAALANLPGAEGVRVPNGMDGWEIAARVILGQQVTVAAARTLTRRLVERFGEPIETPMADLSRLFPSAHRIAHADAADIGTLGIVRQRVGALQALAREVDRGRVELHRGAPLQATLAALRAVPGIGEWTVQLIAMRALAWPDAFPATDIGVMKALGTRDAKVVAERAVAWRPWRSYAVMRLWQSLETGT